MKNLQHLLSWVRLWMLVRFCLVFVNLLSLELCIQMRNNIDQIYE